MNLPKVIHSGSVKDIRMEEGTPEYCYFEYSDRYSVFDWGEMPNSIDKKGNALAFMGGLFFNILNDDIDNHFKSLVDDKGDNVDLLTPTNIMKVKRVEILRPSRESQGWDYSIYKNNPVNALVPLEVIFRFSAPTGSSLYNRIGDVSYCKEIGIENLNIDENTRFDRPIVEFSTKLEEVDRYLTYTEAKEIAGMTDSEFTKLYNQTVELSMKLKNIFNEIGIDLLDGKFEFGFTEGRNERNFMLVDSVGPDELRLTYNGMQLSKELLRQFYRKTPWYEAQKRAKTVATKRGITDWKGICSNELRSTPSQIPNDMLGHYSNMYLGLANLLSTKFFKKEVFKSSVTLDESLRYLKERL